MFFLLTWHFPPEGGDVKGAHCLPSLALSHTARGFKHVCVDTPTYIARLHAHPLADSCLLITLGEQVGDYWGKAFCGPRIRKWPRREGKLRLWGGTWLATRGRGGPRGVRVGCSAARGPGQGFFHLGLRTMLFFQTPPHIVLFPLWPERERTLWLTSKFSI